MIVTTKRGGYKPYQQQERLAKEDIRLLIECAAYCSLNSADHVATKTRFELLIGKLKRMEKQ